MVHNDYHDLDHSSKLILITHIVKNVLKINFFLLESNQKSGQETELNTF